MAWSPRTIRPRMAERRPNSGAQRRKAHAGQAVSRRPHPARRPQRRHLRTTRRNPATLPPSDHPFERSLPKIVRRVKWAALQAGQRSKWAPLARISQPSSPRRRARRTHRPLPRGHARPKLRATRHRPRLPPLRLQLASRRARLLVRLLAPLPHRTSIAPQSVMPTSLGRCSFSRATPWRPARS